MVVRRFKPLVFWSMMLLLFLFFSQTHSFAQEAEEESVAKLIITSVSAERLPLIELTAYGRDDQGTPLDLSTPILDIEHAGSTVGPIEYLGPHTVGAFTLFLIDIPPGVANQLTAVQDAILQYASQGNMTETVDAVAVYQVGGTGPAPLLEASNFHNDVRNLFNTPLQPETGATALYDSTGQLLEQIQGQKPNEAMAASIVLMTDGTDSVSRQFDGDELIRDARELGIPIHTIHLTNQNLGNPEPGIEFLTNLAAETGGIHLEMEPDTDFGLIWDRINGFRNQSRISYTVGNLTAGENPIVISLTDNPVVRAEAAVIIPMTIPRVEILLSAEGSTLSLPELPTADDPLRLRFRTAVSWLDGTERELSNAFMVINNETETNYKIPLDDLDEFALDLTNLNYGNNTIEVSVLDEQGLTAISPTVILTVEDGPRQIPDELAAGSVLVTTLLRVALILGILAVVLVGVLMLWRTGGIPRTVPNLGEIIPRGPSGRVQRKTPVPEDARYIPTHTVGYLEVIAADSDIASPVPLSSAMVRLGRSPGQCDVPFEQDITMSRLHANLMLEGNDYRIFDENSTSGTFVNDRQVPEYGIQLLDGDEIHMGAVHLRYRKA